MKCLFIYNPSSGKGKVVRKLEFIIKQLRLVYSEITVHKSLSADDIKQIIKATENEYDAIIFSGGDGTFNDVTSGVSCLSNRPVLGYIPTGTTNDIARNLKIPRSIKGALKVILAQQTIKHDVGRINDEYFMYVVAYGACTGTSYTTKQETKKILGRLAYARNGINEFFKPNVSKITITSGDTKIEAIAPLVLVLNTISVGGIPFNRYGYLNDGLFDVVLINNGPGAGRFNIIKFFISGILGWRSRRHAVCIKGSKIAINVDSSEHWCVDGEQGPQGNVIIENIHNHLTIFAPGRKARRQKNRN